MKKIESSNERKYYEFVSIMNCYIKVLLKGGSVGKELESKGIKKIAIYGMSFLGERLLEDLSLSNINVEYAIDKRADQIDTSIPVYLPSDELPQVDVCIVTTILEYEAIKNYLLEKTSIEKVLELKDLIYKMI